MIMWFNRKTFRVIRSDTPVGFQKKTWTEEEPIVGTFVYISSMPSNAIRNNQLFAEAKALIFCNLKYESYIQQEDRLIDSKDQVFRVITDPIVCENVLKHIEVAVTDVQNFTEIEEIS